MLPNFLIIGAQKSGTTFLYHMMKKHPQVYMPTTKEVNFFNSKDAAGKVNPMYEDFGLEWYKKFFPDSSQAVAIGEASPLYLTDDLALNRILRTLPKTKLIVILRDPVARAVSAYKMLVSRGELSGQPPAIFHENSEVLLKPGLYHQHLVQAKLFFGNSKIKIIRFVDLVTRTDELMSEVWDFLGVQQYAPAFDWTKNNTNMESGFRWPWLGRRINSISGILRRDKIGFFVLDSLKKTGVTSVVKSLNACRGDAPVVGSETIEFLEEYYRSNRLNILRDFDLRI